jgi:hypothetical protein
MMELNAQTMESFSIQIGGTTRYSLEAEQLLPVMHLFSLVAC